MSLAMSVMKFIIFTKIAKQITFQGSLTLNDPLNRIKQINKM